MSLWKWITSLIKGRSHQVIEEIADRLDRFADRLEHTGDHQGGKEARSAAIAARLARTPVSASRIEREFLNKRGLRPDGRPFPPQRGVNSNGLAYLKHKNEVRIGGSTPWRYNNPGYVRCTDQISNYGALGCDGEYAIFPDLSSGWAAFRLYLIDNFPGKSICDALSAHFPPGVSLDPNQFCLAAGWQPEMNVQDLEESHFRSLDSTLSSLESWSVGEVFRTDATDCPDWVSSEFSSSGGDFSDQPSGTDTNLSPLSETQPTDNS